MRTARTENTLANEELSHWTERLLPEMPLLGTTDEQGQAHSQGWCKLKKRLCKGSDDTRLPSIITVAGTVCVSTSTLPLFFLLNMNCDQLEAEGSFIIHEQSTQSTRYRPELPILLLLPHNPNNDYSEYTLGRFQGTASFPFNESPSLTCVYNYSLSLLKIFYVIIQMISTSSIILKEIYISYQSDASRATISLSIENLPFKQSTCCSIYSCLLHTYSTILGHVK